MTTYQVHWRRNHSKLWNLVLERFTTCQKAAECQRELERQGFQTRMRTITFVQDAQEGAINA